MPRYRLWTYRSPKEIILREESGNQGGTAKIIRP